MVVTINGRPPNYSGDEMPLVDQLRQELKLAEEGLANYAQENEKLGALIAEHNQGCKMACETRKNCEPYTSRKLRCPDCPQDYLIELPPSAGHPRVNP